MKKKKLDRVDVQTSILMAVIVIVSCTIIHAYHYYIAYDDMIKNLEERSDSIYQFIEKQLDKSTFCNINTKEDKEHSLYKETKEFLENIKGATGVRYLYTAKRNEDGQLVYIIDGLDYEALDFRNPGDEIEPEIIPAMEKALDNQVVLPDGIQKTDWGKIFITYYPVHDENHNVVGVVGIEFGAERQYTAYRNIRMITPIVIIGVCLVSIWLSVLFFRRISNPSYHDMSNTDQLTACKNRNAYDVDLKNIIAKQEEKNLGFVILDLNDLKKLNDTKGHQAGDDYIRAASRALKENSRRGEVVYRIGGDEFVVIIRNATEEKLASYIKNLQSSFPIAAGGAIFDPDQDEDIFATCRRADAAMYRDKKIYHQKKDAVK